MSNTDTMAEPGAEADKDAQGEKHAVDPRQQAGQDASIAERLSRDPECVEAQLDTALDESMDASDPPSQTQPGSSTDAAPSSGFDPDCEEKRRTD